MMKESMDSFGIVLCADDDFLPGFKVTLGSILISSKLKDCNIYIGVELGGKYELIWQCARELCAQYHFPAERCHLVVADIEPFKKLQPLSNGSYLTYLRYSIIEKTAENLIIYLDADTLILSDLGRLVGLLPQDKAIAAVQDRYSPTHRKGDPYSIDGKQNDYDSPYFNSGVFVMDKTKLPFRSFAEAFNQLSSRVTGHSFSDQSFLNILFRDRWHQLPIEWNYLTMPRLPAWFSVKDRPSVIHYVTGDKPWTSGYFDFSNLIWHGFARMLNVEVSTDVLNRFHREKLKFLRAARLPYVLVAKRICCRMRGSNHVQLAQINQKLYFSRLLEISRDWFESSGINPTLCEILADKPRA